MFQFKSIRTKFVLFISLLILLPVGIFVGIVIDLRLRSLSKMEDMNSTLITNTLQAEWKKKVRSLATIMGKTLAQPMYALDIYEMHYLARLAMEGESFSYVYVQDKEGRVLVDATEGSNLVGEVLNDPLSKRSLATEGLIIQRDKQTDIVDIAVPIIIGKTKIGIVRIGYSLEEIQKTIFTMTSKVSDNIGQSIKKSIRNIIFLLIVIIVPAFVFGSFFVRSLVKPIKRLVQGTEKIAKGDLTYRIETRSRDEIGQLAASFNKMVKDLQKTTVSKDYMDNIITSMADTLIVLTPKVKIQTVNQATCDLLGYKEEELVGMPVEMVFSGNEKSIKRIFTEDLIIKDFIRSGEETYISKDGGKIPVLFSASAMRDLDGILQGIICMALDITERRKLEKELKELNKYLEQRVAERTTALVKTNEELQIEITEHKRTEAALIEARNKAEVANRAKSRFLANMSHELRTPLNSIIGFSEIIKDKAFGKINEKQEKHLNNINKSGKSLLGMIDDIIDLSRVDAGIIELELEELSIPLILSEAVETVKPSALKKNIQINTRMCETLLTINADKARLGKIINILLDNALKFTPDGGKIKLEANRIEDKLQVSVTDTGIGVKPELREHIFKGFEQADGSYTRKFGGVGIGLTLAKKITELCGGKIWVESPPGEGLALEAGKGSSFVFEIACKAA